MPELRGFTQEDAGITLADEGLGAEIGEAAATELCVGLASGQVASTEPSAETPLEEGDTVTLHVCE